MHARTCVYGSSLRDRRVKKYIGAKTKSEKREGKRHVMAEVAPTREAHQIVFFFRSLRERKIPIG